MVLSRKSRYSISMVMPFHPHVQYQCGFHWRDFRKIWYGALFTKVCQGIRNFYRIWQQYRTLYTKTRVYSKLLAVTYIAQQYTESIVILPLQHFQYYTAHNDICMPTIQKEGIVAFLWQKWLHECDTSRGTILSILFLIEFTFSPKNITFKQTRMMCPIKWWDNHV
jgi:hypothetical protein